MKTYIKRDLTEDEQRRVLEIQQVLQATDAKLRELKACAKLRAYALSAWEHYLDAALYGYQVAMLASPGDDEPYEGWMADPELREMRKKLFFEEMAAQKRFAQKEEPA